MDIHDVEDMEECENSRDKYWFSYKAQFAGTHRDLEHEERKHNAILYIRANFEKMIKINIYRYIYYEIIDDGIRYDNPLAFESYTLDEIENIREIEGDILDEEVCIRGEELVNLYKEDLQYIVKWIKSGKTLISFVNNNNPPA